MTALPPARERICELLCLRLPADRAVLAAVVAGSGLPDGQLARLARRIGENPGWPAVPLSGKVAYALVTGLQAAGAVEQVPGCAACGRWLPLAYEGPLGLTCRGCGPRTADGASERHRRPQPRTCQAGTHRVPAGGRRCAACADEEGTAVIVASIELPYVFRTGKLRLFHATACPFRYSSMTSCGVR